MNETHQPGNAPLDALTPREAAVLALIAENKSNQEIASQESLALSSVKWYINQIFSKLGVKTRAEAIAMSRAIASGKAGAPAAHNNLPRQLTSFIGREVEIRRLLELTTTQPLVTVTGSGGAGKTRLALQTAEKALAHFPDGVWLVELAPLADREQVPAAVANVLRLKEIPGQPPVQTLCDFLRAKKALILLDNCEHVIGAAAELTHELLHACPQLHILATSREILGTEGETAFRCPSLGLPDPKQSLPLAELSRVEALRLFVERAQSVSPGFSLTEANIAHAAAICRRLDGIPLAIELAVARLRLLSIDQIASRLDQVFRLLTGGSRTELPRHQTLKALIDWSYNLLSEQEKLLLLRLSVFAGGWTVEGAEAVCADERLNTFEVLDLLGQLLDKSLVGMEAETKSGQPRYRILETIRQYAHDRLVESGRGAEVRERHLDYYLLLSQKARPELRGGGLRAWCDELDEEIDNLRMAVEWAISGSLEKGLFMAAALTRYLMEHNWFDGTDWLQRLLASEVSGTPEERSQPERRAARGKALTALGLVGDSMGIDKYSLAKEATTIFEDLGSAFELDWALALSIWNGKDPRPLAVFRKAGDLFGITEALWPLIKEAIYIGDLPQACALVEESLALSRQIGHLPSISAMLFGLAHLELMEGDQDRAKEFAQACIDCEQALEDKFSLGVEIFGLAEAINGNYPNANQVYTHGLAIGRIKGDRGIIAHELAMLAWIAWASGSFDLADQYYQEVDRLSEFVSDFIICYARYAETRIAISRREYKLAFERLNVLTLHWIGNYQYAPVHLLTHTFGILAEAEGQFHRAAVLFGAQDFIARNLMNISTPTEREAYTAALSSTHTALGETEFAAAFGEGKAMSLEQALAYARRADTA